LLTYSRNKTSIQVLDCLQFGCNNFLFFLLSSVLFYSYIRGRGRPCILDEEKKANTRLSLRERKQKIPEEIIQRHWKAFTVNPGQSITFAGLVMNGNRTWIQAGQNIRSQGNSKMHLRIENCTFNGRGGNGIQLWGVSDMVLKNSRFCISSISADETARVSFSLLFSFSLTFVFYVILTIRCKQISKKV